MSRHFCCCIPVRVAVFVSSLLTFLISVLVAGVSIFILTSRGNPSYPSLQNLGNVGVTELIVVAVVYGLIALISFFGFIGSIIRKRTLVALYSTMTILALLFQTAADIYFTYNTFRSGRISCENLNPSLNSKDCTDFVHAYRIVIVVFISVIFLLQLYGVVVIRRYVKQLDEEQNYYRASSSVNAAFNLGPTGKPAYYAHAPLQQEQDQALLDPQGHYAYSDPHHSFGGGHKA